MKVIMKEMTRMINDFVVIASTAVLALVLVCRN